MGRRKRNCLKRLENELKELIFDPEIENKDELISNPIVENEKDIETHCLPCKK